MRYENGTLYLSGRVDKYNVPDLYEQLARTQKKKVALIDLGEVERVDSAGIAFIQHIQESVQDGKPELVNVPPHAEKSLSLFSIPKEEITEEEKEHPLYILGDILFSFWRELSEFFIHTADLTFWSLVGIFNKKSQRKGELVKQSILIGLNSVGIVSLLSIIVGLIIALQSAAQLRQFGAGTFIADLIGISVVREMGPLMTAIIIAGRSGSAIAAEISTMKVSEEMDALNVMALNPVRYVMVPKVFAITLCMPVLVALSILLGIGGGMVIAFAYLNITPVTFMSQVVEALSLGDISVGIIKSVFFAWAIVIVSTFFGTKASGGSEGVGRMTTRAVVVSIFSVILLDVLFSFIYLS